jgi:single-strand DNA-binding protein
MNETLVTVVGNVATQPEIRKSAAGALSARFRLATTVRRWDRERAAWADGHTSFYTVWAWRQLGENVAGSVSVGEPLVVQGRLRVREERGADGQRWTSAEIDAVAVGHDLARGTSAFRRMNGPRPELTAPLGGVAPGTKGDPAPARSPAPQFGPSEGSDPGSAGMAEPVAAAGGGGPFWQSGQ